MRMLQRLYFYGGSVILFCILLIGHPRLSVWYELSVVVMALLGSALAWSVKYSKKDCEDTTRDANNKGTHQHRHIRFRKHP